VALLQTLFLTLVLKPINEQLATRIIERDPTAIPPKTLSYHDDTSIVIPYQDIQWFLHTFQNLGNPFRIRLNLTKTQILTSLTDLPPELTATDQTCLNALLQNINPQAEQRRGIRLLGQPVGSATFAHTFLEKHIATLHHTLSNQLRNKIQNLQTQIAILKHCAIPSSFHLLATHLYHLWHPDVDQSLYYWNSDATLTIRILIHDTIANITQQGSLPPYVIPLLHLPATLGGIGIRDPITATIPAYITAVTRTL
jgi:hypothetical protein